MLYVIYNIPSDIDELVTDSLTDALHMAGDLLDTTKDPSEYTVFKIDMTEAEYDSSQYIENLESQYTLKEFVNDEVSIFDPEPKKIPLVERERYHNLDRSEQLAVLEAIPDDILIMEIKSRVDNYIEALTQIRQNMEGVKLI